MAVQCAIGESLRRNLQLFVALFFTTDTYGIWDLVFSRRRGHAHQRTRSWHRPLGSIKAAALAGSHPDFHVETSSAVKKHEKDRFKNRAL